MYYDNLVKGEINEYDKPLTLLFPLKHKKDTQETYPLNGRYLVMNNGLIKNV